MEKALEEGCESIKELMHKFTVYFKFDEEEERYNSSIAFSQSDSLQDENSKTLDDSSVIYSHSSEEKIELYSQIISRSIMVIINQISTSSQTIVKLNSLHKIIENTLLNICK